MPKNANTAESAPGVRLVTGVHGIDLTDYLRTVGEMFSVGMSVGEAHLDRATDKVARRLEELPVQARRDVYVTILTGAAGLYLSSRKLPLGFIRYLALRRIVEGDEHLDPPHESVLYDLDLSHFGRLDSIPKPTAAVAVDLPRVIKALKSGGKAMPTLSVDEMADKLTPNDVALLMKALVQFARECSAHS